MAAAALSRKSRRYLQAGPERREAPPPDLLGLIDRVLQRGTALGFLKQQRGAAEAADGAGPAAGGTGRYELAHDALGELFQQFALDFEGWMRHRTVLLYGALIGTLVVLPAFINDWRQHGIGGAFLSLLGGAALVTFIWLLRRLFGLAVELAVFPLVRRLAVGRVPLGEGDAPGKRARAGRGSSATAVATPRPRGHPPSHA